MQIMIEIPKPVYSYIMQTGSMNMLDTQQIANAIFDGTPLPKGHGRLIDAYAYRKKMLDSREFDFFKRLDMQPTIIEADVPDTDVGKIAESEQEPCEDYVSREAVLEIFGDIHPLDYNTNAYASTIKALPSVTPQQKTGHWKRISIDKYSTHANYWYRCDRCGEDNLGDTAWCPSCGCRMEGKNEEI